MKIYTDKELKKICSRLRFDDFETDLQGQVLFYTEVFLWNDGTYRDEPDPSFEG